MKIRSTIKKEQAVAELNYAVSVTNIKAADDDLRIIEGIASTPTPDRMGDVVEPLGAVFKLPLPLLWQHNSGLPVGWVEFAKPTKAGIPFKARVAKVEEPGELKNSVDKAWQAVKAGLVRGVSIGFRRLEHSVMDDGGWRFTKWEWLELSLVTIPAQSEATINTIKTVSIEQRAALGHSSVVEKREPPGDSGKKVETKTTPAKPKRGTTMAKKTIAEQIAAFRTEKSAKETSMDALMAKGGEGDLMTLDEADQEEYDTLEKECDEIEKHIERLEKHQARVVSRATEVDGSSEKKGSDSRSSVPRLIVKSQLPVGTAFTRYVTALAQSKGNIMHAVEISKKWTDTPEVETVIRAAVAAGTTTDATWAAPLVPYQQMASEFIELLRPKTFLGRLPLRRVPFNISMPGQTAGSSVNWVGEGAPKPVSALAFNTTTLRWAKAAGIVVFTEELMRLSNPAAEAIVRQDLIDAIAKFLDEQFLGISIAEVSNVSPASVTNGVTPIIASGLDADDLRADVKAVFSAMIALNMSAAGCYWLMSERMALSIAMMTNPLGQPEFPAINAEGGTFAGLPVLTSENVPQLTADITSPIRYAAGDMIVLIKPSEVMLADDGGVAIDVSNQASLQMDSVPTNPPVAATVLQSLWQMNMVGVRAERWINWKKRRSGAVQWIAGANYGDAA